MYIIYFFEEGRFLGNFRGKLGDCFHKNRRVLNLGDSFLHNY